MKKKTLLIVSTSFALGVGVIGSGVGALLHQKASTPGVMEDATLPSMKSVLGLDLEPKVK